LTFFLSFTTTLARASAWLASTVMKQAVLG